MNWTSFLETVMAMAKDVFIRDINEEAYEKFKSALMAVYGDYYGRLGEEASKAFSIYADILMGRYTLVENGTRTHKNSDAKTQSDIQSAKIRNLSKQKIRRLTTLLEDLKDIEVYSEEHLVEAIMRNLGCHDRRTIRNYIRLLQTLWVVKPEFKSGVKWYRVLRDRLEAILAELNDFVKFEEVKRFE